MYEGGKLMEIALRDILPNRFQPRIRFDEQKLTELSESIRKYGVIQPIVVRPINNKYEIIAGERRFKASQLANRQTIPCIVVAMSDKESEEIALLENIQRQELTAIEEAVSYKRILDMGYITQEGLAKKLGKTQSTIANKIRLLNLDDKTQDSLLHGKISERHARALLRLTNKKDQLEMLDKIIKERLTVKKTDEEIKHILETRPQPQVKTKDEEIIEKNKEFIENLFNKSKTEPATPVSIRKFKPKQEVDEKQERRQGFMDIDKIIKEAKDINVEKPVNDIADLLKQEPTMVSKDNPAPEPQILKEPTITSDNSQIDHTRFINFQTAVREPEQESVPTPEAQSTVSFDSIFNQMPTLEPEQKEIYKENEPDAKIIEKPNLDNFQEEPKSKISSTIASVFGSSEVNKENESIEQEPQIPVEPLFQSETEYMEETIPSKIEVENEKDVLSTIPTDEIYDENSQSQKQVISEEVIPKTPTAPAVNNFKQVIDLIRNCAEQIENLGYYIDVDEMDLEESYQVTFKINKE